MSLSPPTLNKHSPNKKKRKAGYLNKRLPHESSSSRDPTHINNTWDTLYTHIPGLDFIMEWYVLLIIFAFFSTQCPRPNPQQIGLYWHIRSNRSRCPAVDVYSDRADWLKCKGSCLYNLSFPPKTLEFNHWWVVAPSEEARLSQQAVSLK